MPAIQTMSKFPKTLFTSSTADASDEFRFLGVVAHAQNEALAYVSQDLIVDDPEGFDSATNPSNWTVVARDPRVPSVADPSITHVPADTGVPTYTPEIGEILVDDDDTRQLRLRFNTFLEPRVVYDVTIGSSVRGVGCRSPAGALERSFKSLFRGIGAPRFVQDDIYRDWDMRFFPDDRRQGVATWRLDSTTDIGIQPAAASLEKRILRRLLAAPGEFSHLGPTYGIHMSVRRLARAGELQSLASRAAEQIRQEPDVRDARVDVRLDFGQDGSILADLHCRAQLVDGQEAAFDVQVPVGARRG